MEIINSLRDFRVLGYAIFDLILSFGGIYLSAPLLTRLFRKTGMEISRLSWILFTFPISIAVHFFTGNITPMTEQFLDPKGYYILKLVIVTSTLYGVSKIKRSPSLND